MRTLKVPSAFTPVTQKINPEDYIPFEKELWEFKISNQAFYPRSMKDLIRFYPLVIKYVVEKLKAPYEKIAISLPAEDFLKETEEGFATIKAIEERTRKETGKEITLEAYPQGLAAIYKMKKDNEIEHKGNLLIIDGGFNTVNAMIVNKEMKITWIRTYHNEIGVRNLLDSYFYEEIKKVATVPRNLQVIKNIFLSGEIDRGIESIDITPEKEKAISRFMPKMLEKVTLDLQIATDEKIDEIAIIGGISHYIKEENLKTKKKLFIPKENGEFYNVMGMFIKSETTSIDFGFGDIKICLPE